MRPLCCVLLLASCVSNAAPQSPLPSSERAVQDLTARDALLPLAVFDGSSTCSNHVVRHLEVVRVADGTTAWSNQRWGQLLGELASGDLVVTNLDTEERTKLEVAVLARADGAVRWSCSSELPKATESASWTLTESGAMGQLVARYSQGGAAHPSPPQLDALELELSEAGCELHTQPGSGLAPVAISALSQREWNSADIVVRLEPPVPGAPNAGPSFGPPAHLVATRAGQTLWNREIQTQSLVPCLAP
jgi:hypothetical protein